MEDGLSTGQFVALLIPLILVELALVVFALRDLVKRKRVRGGNKWVWVALILVLNLIGPILYFVLAPVGTDHQGVLRLGHLPCVIEAYHFGLLPRGKI